MINCTHTLLQTFISEFKYRCRGGTHPAPPRRTSSAIRVIKTRWKKTFCGPPGPISAWGAYVLLQNPRFVERARNFHPKNPTPTFGTRFRPHWPHYLPVRLLFLFGDGPDPIEIHKNILCSLKCTVKWNYCQTDSVQKNIHFCKILFTTICILHISNISNISVEKRSLESELKSSQYIPALMISNLLKH